MSDCGATDAAKGAWGTGQRALERALFKIQSGEPLISICGSGSAVISSDGIVELAGAVARQTRILSFQLRSNNIGDAGAAKLAGALEQHTQLRKLDLTDNSIGNSGMLRLCQVLLPPSTSLRSLWLQDNRMGDEAAVRLANVLSQHPGLEELELGGNTVGEAGAAELMQLMKEHQSLRVLGLERNAVGNTGASILAEALQHGSSLRRLNLSYNGIGDTGALRLASALDRHAALQELHLSDNQISDVGALALARALRGHAGLRALFVERNRIGDRAVMELLTVLTRMTREDVICNLAGNPSTRFDALSLTNLTVVAQTIKSLSHRGMQLKHMLSLWKDGTLSGTIDEATTTTAEFAFSIVRPEMANYDVCSAQFHHAPIADTYVIHAWTGLLRNLIQAVASHATGDPTVPLDPDHLLFLRTPEALERSYYIDVFTMDQNSSADLGHPRCQMDKFDLVLSEFQLRHAKVMLVADANYLVLTRLWCLAEAQCAVQCAMDMEVGFGEMRPFPRKRRGTRVLDAECSRPVDHAWLFKGIEARGGADFVDHFDATVTSAVEATFRTYYRQMFPLLPKHRQDELYWLEAQDNAREDLIAATADDNIKLLSKCIAYAEEVHIEQAPIRAGMQKRAALMLTKSAELTRTSLQRAREEAERIVSAARRRLPESEYEERLELAREQLKAALDGTKKMAVGWAGSVAATEAAAQALQRSIPEALEADVEEEMVVEARLTLAELLIIAACKGEDPSSMEKAICSAKQNGVQGAVLKAAEQRLARKRLAVLADTGDWQALVRAVLFAEEQGVDAEVVEPARVRLAELAPEAVPLATFAGVLSSILHFLDVGKSTSLANVCTWLKPLPHEVSTDLLTEATGALKQAIEMAEDASLEGEALEAARQDLEGLEHELRKRTARAELFVTSKADDLRRLGSCVAVAEEMGVEDVLLAVARRKVAELELAAATASGDADDLLESIESAKNMGVKKAGVEAAKQKLSMVDPDAYKRILCGEMVLACEREDRDALRHAITLVVQAGGEGEEVSAAYTRLSELDLTAAVELGEVEGLQSAIAEAVLGGVAEASVQAARRKLAEVELAAASEKTSIQGLIDSIEKAKEVGVGGQHIAAAEGRLAKLQLVAAMKLREIDVLEQAIERVAATDDADENLAVARRKLAEWKLVALDKASCGEEELRQALEVAAEAGVREAVMAAPRKRLLLLELTSASSGECVAVLEEALVAAVKVGIGGEPVERGRQQLVLLKMRDAACETDVEALQEAIAAAVQAAVEKQEIEAAKRKLAKLDPEAYKECVIGELATTTANSTDVDALQDAIDAAVKAGADEDEVAPANRRLVELMVSEAAEAEDDKFVRRALAMADALGAEDVPGLEAARSRLAGLEQEERKKAGHSRLVQAIEGGDLTELQSAFAEAKLLGVDPEVIKVAKSRLE